jgi:hypothetical protein
MLLPIHSYQDANANTSRLVNCYTMAAQKGARSPLVLRTAPGVVSFATCGSGPGRGVITFQDTLYAVSGNTLYRVSASGAATALGTVPGVQRVHMAQDGQSLVIVSNGNGYVWDGSTLAQITDPDFRTAGACAFIDSYIVFVEKDTGRFFGSDLLNAASYDSLNFATAEAFPDKLITLAVDHRQIALFGTDTMELWYNAGGSGFPFERSPNGVVELGIAAEHGVTQVDNSLVWLASDRTIRRLSGLTPQKVSQYGVEKALRGYARVDDCEAFSYTHEGQLCAVFRFPSAGATWVYNASVGEFHERETYPDTAWLVNDAAQCYQQVLVQNPQTGAIGTLSAASMTEWGNTLRPEWTYQPIYNKGGRVYQSEIVMECETGIGLSVGQGSNPQILLEYSNDGGREWIAHDARSLGAQGKYLQRVRWNRLGQSRNRVYRAWLSDPVPLIVSATELYA